MKGLRLLTFALSFSISALGAVTSFGDENHAAPTKINESRIKAGLSKLPTSDRKLAELQRYCAVNPDNRLGSMGAPLKIQVAGKPVFLCCEGCKEDALAKPNETVATAENLKKATAALAKLTATDREVAEAQAFCAVMVEHRLGSMGVPVKVMVSGKPVFLCCGGCRDQALADPRRTLAKAEKMKEGNPRQ